MDTKLIDAYLDGAKSLRQAVAGLSSEQAKVRPIAGKWSTLEVVCHLSDFEPVFVERMKRIIALENATFQGADENRFAATLAYHDRDLEEELRLVEVTRSQMARILRKLPDSALDRVGVHNEKGPKTLRQILETATGHITHHLKFIAEKRKALGA